MTNIKGGDTLRTNTRTNTHAGFLRLDYHIYLYIVQFISGGKVINCRYSWGVIQLTTPYPLLLILIPVSIELCLKVLLKMELQTCNNVL